MTQPVLEVDGLTTSFQTRQGEVRAVNNVSFSVSRGRIMGLVGESGSGKSVTGFSLLRLVDPPGRIIAGRVRLDGTDLLTLPEAGLRKIRGARIAMIFQDPMMTLNPVLRIGTQMAEAIQAHRKVSRPACREEVVMALDQVGIPSPVARLDSYPHELSGGMRQRVAIAIAFLNKPDVIIADEPTTALDVTIQSQILAEAQKMCDRHNTAMIWITHDLSVVAGLADEIAVMYAGRIVETGLAADVLSAPLHPYTHGLIRSVPGTHIAGTRLFQIPGSTPSLLSLGQECAFSARCMNAREVCKRAPEATVLGERSVRCRLPVGKDVS